jgi:isocitrate/isopropylmalate dehydrogenase
MMRHMGEHKIADRIMRAIHDVLSKGEHVTRDLGGSADTAGFTDAIIDAL